MTPTPDEIWNAVAAERITLADLLETLAEADWERPSLCDGWRVRDVVAHVILSSNAHVASLLFNLLRARGSIDRLNLEMAIRHADRTTPRQLLAELRSAVPLRATPPGTTPADRLMDVLVHIQDIALPLGLTRDMPTASARLAIDRVVTSRWFRGAQERYSAYHLRATDTDWSFGTGPTVAGSLADLLLLVTSRTARLSALTGEGAERLLPA